MGNVLSFLYDRQSKIALDSRTCDIEEDVILLDSAEEDVYEDSSTVEVGILKDGRDQKPKESNGHVEDLKWCDGKGVDGNFQPSSSPIPTNARNEMLDSLPSDGALGASVMILHKKILSNSERRISWLNLLELPIDCMQNLWKKLKSYRPQRKVEAETLNKEVLAEAFKPLTEEEETAVSEAFSSSDLTKLLVAHKSSNIDITVEVIQCLRPRMWLNDEVINLYLELLKERENRQPKKFLKCHFFNSFFYKKLVGGEYGYSYQAVRRWTSQRKLGYTILECDKIFVPIHKEVHWCLAVINKKDEKFQYLDSLGGFDSFALKVLAKYFMDEVKDKNGKVIDVSSWKQEFVEDLPRQENRFDCGLFMIKYADFCSRETRLCFKQEHMHYFRRSIAKEILQLKAK